jgi:hypothetical protein
VNNTVADNSAQNGVIAGVLCSGAYSLANSIIWGNGGSPQYVSCVPTYSDVMGLPSPPPNNNISVDPNFNASYQPQAAACFNSGTNAAVANISIDITNTARIKPPGTGIVDMGAYEMQ